MIHFLFLFIFIYYNNNSMKLISNNVSIFIELIIVYHMTSIDNHVFNCMHISLFVNMVTYIITIFIDNISRPHKLFPIM